MAYTTNKYIWCGTQLCEQRDSTGGTVTKRFFGEGEQIGGTNYYFTRDHLGSVREMTDGTGAIMARYDYDPYGNRTKTSGTMDADFGFTGDFVLASQPNTDFTLYRLYRSDLGRWPSRDPLGEAGGINLYDYVANNPINEVDTDGRFALVEVLVYVGVASIIASGLLGYYESGNKSAAAKKVENNNIKSNDWETMESNMNQSIQNIVPKGAEDIYDAANGIVEFPTEAAEIPGTVLRCHRAVENRPRVGTSKPATLK